uniref:Uncharacterized protein n=1 Tax=viral metagenome TaxID=1070528 RepID=A0A6M3XM12_9ZZZZ
MELKSMKLTAKQAKTMDSPSAVSPSKPKYPWGLSISLEKEALDKLGIEISDFDVGEIVSIAAKARITRITISDGTDYQERSMNIQIEKMALNQGESKEDLDWDTPKDDADRILKKRRLVD